MGLMEESDIESEPWRGGGLQLCLVARNLSTDEDVQSIATLKYILITESICYHLISPNNILSVNFRDWSALVYFD